MAAIRLPVRALLLGIEAELARELIDLLELLCADVRSADFHATRVDFNAPADIVFCSAKPEIVARLRAACPEAGIVVVTRHPEVTDWLDSIEAGADDYCAAPFETAHLQWILQNTLRPVAAAA